MQQILFAMFAAGLFLAVRDMAKVFFQEKERTWMYEMPQERQLWLKAEAFRTLSEELAGQPQENVQQGNEKTAEECIWQRFRQKACMDCSYRKNCDKVGRITRKRCAMNMLTLLGNNDMEQYEEQLPQWLNWCSRGRDTIRDLQFCMEEYRREQFWQKRLNGIRQVTAMQLGEIAHMLRQSARESGRYSPLGQVTEKRIRNRAYRAGCVIGEIWMLEMDNKRLRFFMTLRSRNHRTVPLEQMTKILEAKTGRHITADSRQKVFIGEEYVLYSFTETVRYELLCGVSRRPGNIQAVCGDNYSIFTEDGYAQICLSDGMGSGAGADQASERVLNLLEEFMACGFSKEVAFQMIHTTLLLQEPSQAYATLDICQVNLYTGICEFMKAGAAASYIIRGHRVEKIELPAMAPGLTEKTGYEKLRVRLRPGDHIVMVTDGVTDGFEKSGPDNGMEPLLSRLQPQAPGKMSEAILAAVPVTKEERTDDMTVLVAGFWDRRE